MATFICDDSSVEKFIRTERQTDILVANAELRGQELATAPTVFTVR